MNKIKSKFQKMWEAHAMGVWASELVAKNFANTNIVMKKKAGVQEKNVIFFYKKDLGTQFFYNTREMNLSADFGYKKFRDKRKVKDYLNKSNKTLERGDKSYTEFLKIDLKAKDIQELFEYYNKQVEICNEI